MTVYTDYLQAFLVALKREQRTGHHYEVRDLTEHSFIIVRTEA